MKHQSRHLLACQKISVADSREHEVISDPDYLEELLTSKGLLKTLTLLLANQAGLKVPPTLLMLEPNSAALERFGEEHEWPLMVRMDFTKLPRPKTLGGIPIRSLLIAEHINRFLFEHNCYPLYHPHLDRFKDVYSCGIQISAHSKELIIEVVGKGFDAGDLRLGKTTPQESIRASVSGGGFSRVSTVSPEIYSRQRKDRLRRMAQFQSYINYANNHGKLHHELERFSRDNPKSARGISRLIPDTYVPIPDKDVKKLCEQALLIRSMVLPKLPFSKDYVASFSLLPRKKWILWDIYGSWYNR